MNDVQAFIDRQLGFCTRLSYDSVLKRLEVAPEDSFYGLQNSAGDSALEQDSPIFACRFAEAAGYEHILALANEDGRVAIQDTSKVRTNTTLEGFQCHNNAVFDLAWRPGHMSFVTVSGDHTAALWQLTPHGAARTGVCAAHARSVKCAAFRRGAAPLLATGARDGHVLLWDLRTPQQPQQQVVWSRPDNSLWSCHAAAGAGAAGAGARTPGSAPRRRQPGQDRPTSITGLVFQDENTLISCGECDGSIKVWDLRKNYSTCRRAPLPRHCLPYCGASARTGYTNLLVDSAGVRLYASCMDGVIYCFNVATYTHAPEQRYAGHESGTFYIKAALSGDDRYLVSGSSDKHAYLWSVARPRPLARLAGHAAEVTCAAWRAAQAGGDLALVTCSDDARHNIWRVGRGDLETSGRDSERGHSRAGWTEPAPHTESLALLHTPVSVKRRREDTPARTPGSTAKRARSGPAPKSKRCLADMMNVVGRREAGGGGGGGGTSPKRARSEAGPPESDKENRCGGIERRRESEATHNDATPPKRSPPRPGGAALTPPRPGGAALTPTHALPDYVASGEAPHLRLMSPARRRRASPDWLTRLARARPGPPPRRAGDPASPSPAPVAPAPAPAPAPPRAPRTLLSYFNAVSKEK